MHNEYKRIVADAETAVLFIHGILGTPNHFKDFIPLVSESFSIYNMLLDGHGKGVKEFSHTSMKIWKNQVESVIEELLLTHKQVIITAHSMGSLFALQQAAKRPEQIKGLFLLATPLKISVKIKLFINSAKLYLDIIKPNDREVIACKKACGVNLDKRFWLYLGWIPRFLELFKEIKHTRYFINNITTTCLVFQSKNDEMVSKKAINVVKDNSCIKIEILENSSHYYYFKNDYKKLLTEYKKFIKKL